MRHSKPIILCDIDGTLALRGDRGPHDHDRSIEDAVNWPIVQLCDALHQSGAFDLLLVSGREDIFREVTEWWFTTHQLLPYRLGLIMRGKGDHRPDDVVKAELYRTVIEPHYRVHAVLDDRMRVVKAWRDLGLTCLQVAEGNF